MSGNAMAASGLSRRVAVLAVALALLGATGCAQRTDWVEGTLVSVDVQQTEFLFTLSR